MTAFADLHADNAIAAPYFCRGKCSPQKDESGKKGKKG
jgi:hypothetical protein